jgi:hypothetical protein
MQSKFHTIWWLDLEVDLEMNNKIRKSRIYEIKYLKKWLIYEHTNDPTTEETSQQYFQQMSKPTNEQTNKLTNKWINK